MQTLEWKILMTMLHAAIDKGYVKVVEALLEYNADVNSAHEDGMTPLHLAAQRGNAVISKMLLSKGANINAEATPLERLLLILQLKEILQKL